MKKIVALLLLAALCAASCCALAVDADGMQGWLSAFASQLPQVGTLNDPLETADPARPGEFLIEYPFGTVLASSASTPQADEILEIDLRTEQVTDCRGVRVGMPLESALDGGAQLAAEQSTLIVLGTQDAGLGWSWAYVNEAGVYGVEYISYGGEGAQLREYTLTYVIGEEGTVSAIRMRIAEATQAQAEEGMRTAEEIASRQTGEALALANRESELQESDLRAMGTAALEAPVAQFVAALGEPVEVQVLPGAAGRILLYEGAALTLRFDETTGEELVTGVSVSGTGITGPRGLTVGNSVQQATALFRCDADVSGLGGALYVEGEALGEAPYGEMIAQADGGQILRYACRMASGETGLLEIGVQGGAVAYWQMHVGETEARDDG